MAGVYVWPVSCNQAWVTDLWRICLRKADLSLNKTEVKILTLCCSVDINPNHSTLSLCEIYKNRDNVVTHCFFWAETIYALCEMSCIGLSLFSAAPENPSWPQARVLLICAVTSWGFSHRWSVVP